MKMTGEGGGGGVGVGVVPFEGMDWLQLIQGFNDQIKVAHVHFLISVELTPFLSISGC